MDRSERDRLLEKLRVELTCSPHYDKMLVALDHLLASERQAKELLETLVYWHDQGSGHIDESWWDDAREQAKP